MLIIKYMYRDLVSILIAKVCLFLLLGPCTPNPCRNGGTCRPWSMEFSCVCFPGFTGRTCEIKSECEQVHSLHPNLQKKNVDKTFVDFIDITFY